MKLHDYQLRAAEWLRGKPSAILAVEMGLGKTATVLHYIATTAPATCLMWHPKGWPRRCGSKRPLSGA